MTKTSWSAFLRRRGRMVRRRMGWGRVTSHLLLAYDNEKKNSKNDNREREQTKISVKTEIIKTF